MRENVKLKNITSDNLKATEDLELCAGQEDLVTSNLLYSVAKAKFDLSFQRAIDENEDNYYAYNNLGLTLSLLERWEEAVEALEAATASDSMP